MKPTKCGFIPAYYFRGIQKTLNQDPKCDCVAYLPFANFTFEAKTPRLEKEIRYHNCNACYTMAWSQHHLNTRTLEMLYGSTLNDVDVWLFIILRYLTKRDAKTLLWFFQKLCSHIPFAWPLRAHILLLKRVCWCRYSCLDHRKPRVVRRCPSCYSFLHL